MHPVSFSTRGDSFGVYIEWWICADFEWLLVINLVRPLKLKLDNRFLFTYSRNRKSVLETLEYTEYIRCFAWLHFYEFVSRLVPDNFILAFCPESFESQFRKFFRHQQKGLQLSHQCAIFCDALRITEFNITHWYIKQYLVMRTTDKRFFFLKSRS